jgi:hypothetical protein
LLDPTWDVDKFVNSTKSFQVVLRLLSTTDIEGSVVTRQRAQEAIISSRGDTKRCLRSVVFTMGGNLMSTFIDNFLSRYSNAL